MSSEARKPVRHRVSAEAHVGKDMRSGEILARKTPAKAAAKEMGGNILSAPKGPRTLTHREVERAVKAVFKARYGANA